jgi:tRNA pseudouridine55 synthase
VSGAGAAADGVLVVDKPAGMTSFDVVRRIRRAARARRVGHGGTLDPLATGVLPVCLGEATKLTQFLLDADKEYDVTLCFGVETDTLDADGAVTARRDPGGLDEAAVAAALPAFTGPIRQVPPAYSALKRAGRALYDYARAGEAVEVEARAVTVHELRLTGWAGPSAASLHVRCSKGTYVRSLGADLGRALGPGAHVTALRRTRSGPFTAAAARPLDDLVATLERDPDGAAAGDGPALLGLPEALGHLPRCFADDDAARAIVQGKRLAWAALRDAPGAPPEGAPHCVLRPDGALLAVVARRDADDSVRSIRVFNYSYR